MKYIHLIFLSLTALAANASAPKGYYDGLEGKTSVDLKAAAKSAVAGVTTLSYGEPTWDAFMNTDTRTVRDLRIWWDMYSNNLVAVSTGHGGLNIEHSVANSWWGGIKNDAYCDLHHLNPSDSEANGKKSNYPLGKVVTVSYSNGVSTVGKPASGASGGATNVFEPHDAYKGDFARAYFYMFTMYDDIEWLAASADRNYMFDGSAYPSLKPWAVDLLLEWARLDPVDTKETTRNEAVYAAQGNRNPFIDNPGLEEYIWGSKTGVAFHASSDYTALDGVYPEPEEKEAGEGRWAWVRDLNGLNATDTYMILAANTQKYMQPTVTSQYLTAGEQLQVNDGGYIHGTPVDAAFVSFVPVGDNYALGISDAEGGFKGYVCSTVAKKLSLQTDMTKAGVEASVYFDDEEGYLYISYGDAGLLQYNTQSPRFLTYTSSQEKLKLFRRMADDEVEIVPPTNDGTWERPYGVKELLAGTSGEDVWVKGHIVGYVDSSIGNYIAVQTVKFTAEGAPASHVLIAASPNETDAAKVMAVSLPAGALRDAVNLQDNLDRLGAEVSFRGSVEKYFGRNAGLKNVTDFNWGAQGNSPASVPVLTEEDAADALVYDLNGRLMPPGRPQPGIYIVRANNKAFKLIVR